MVLTLLTIVHIVVCLFLIVVVLLQSGKAADLAGAFGGMGSQTAFGPRGSATLLSKATTVSAIVFMVTSLTLSIMATRHAGVGTTILDKHPGPVSTKQPASTVPQTGAKQPTVTLTDPTTGESKTVPFDLNSLPQPPGQQPPAKNKK